MEVVMKAKQVNKIINYGIGISAAYFIGSAIAGAIKRKREGIGGTRHRTFGGNSGYDGYSMSVRAREARRNGKFPKTDFKQLYGLTPKTFDLLVGCDVITSYEWHHTSSWGNETPFYEWDDPNMPNVLDKYSDIPFVKIYNANKEEIQKLSRDKRIFKSKHYRTGEDVVNVPQDIKERIWEIFDI